MDTGYPATAQPPYHSITGCTQVDPGDSSSGDSITSNGGFIAMAAGLSVVVPIICVLIVKFRKAKMAERARLRTAHTAPVTPEIEAADPRIIDLPPPYEQMFGPNFHSFTTVVHPVDSRHFEVFIDENEPIQHRNGSTNDQTDYGLARVFRDQQPPAVTNIGDDTCDGQTCASNLRRNPDHSDSLIATISGSHIQEISSISNISQTSNIGSQSTIILNTLQLRTDNLTVSPPASSHDAHLSPTMHHRDRTYNSEHISSSVYSQVTPRRHPGMHISFEDFSTGGVQDNQADSPPPSYEEALHILETIELAKDHM